MKSKRFLRIFLPLLLITALLAACGRSESSTASEYSSSESPSSSAPSPTPAPTPDTEESASSDDNFFVPPMPDPNPLYTPTDVQPDDTIAERLAAAQEESENVVGWLQIPGMIIDYPVVQGSDNDYYLSHNYKGEDSKNGAIYAHFNSDLSDPAYLPQNTVIFGHNMWVYTDEMFTTLEDFYSFDFAKEHRYLTLTIDGVTTYWLIYAVFDTEVASDDSQYDFYYWNTYGQTEEEWRTVQDGIAERTLYQYDIDVQYEDNLLMLSTCSYHYHNWIGFLRDDVRLVIAARLVREGENLADAPLPTVHEGRREPA